VNVPYILDSGVLIAVDRGDRRVLNIVGAAIDEERKLIVPAVVVGQVWRNGRRQASLQRFLRSCTIEPTLLASAKSAGALCGSSKTGDLVDALVVVCALIHGAIVFTSDPRDIQRLSSASGAKPGLIVRRV
jgi:predicted nucleic acid-binding protein